MKKMNKEKAMELLEKYAEKHPTAVECGGEYIMQDDQAQVDTLQLVSDIFDSMEEQNKGWIPVEERLPETDKYVLLSFYNFPVPQTGRYEEDEEGNGAFYLGDETETCVSQMLFVNAWMELPEKYKDGVWE